MWTYMHAVYTSAPKRFNLPPMKTVYAYYKFVRNGGCREDTLSLTLFYFRTDRHRDSVAKIIGDPVRCDVSNRWVQQVICETIECDVAVW